MLEFQEPIKIQSRQEKRSIILRFQVNNLKMKLNKNQLKLAKQRFYEILQVFHKNYAELGVNDTDLINHIRIKILQNMLANKQYKGVHNGKNIS